MTAGPGRLIMISLYLKYEELVGGRSATLFILDTMYSVSRMLNRGVCVCCTRLYCVLKTQRLYCNTTLQMLNITDIRQNFNNTSNPDTTFISWSKNRAKKKAEYLNIYFKLPYLTQMLSYMFRQRTFSFLA